MEMKANFSDCRKYRYTLKRIWDKKKGNVLFISLNPALAKEKENNSTNIRGITFARDWGYGGVVFCNLFAYRIKSSKELEKIKNPTGKENDKFLIRETKKAKLVIFSWGNKGKIMNRNKSVIKLLSGLSDFYCLGITKQIEPKHILYLKRNTKPIKLANKKRIKEVSKR